MYCYFQTTYYDDGDDYVDGAADVAYDDDYQDARHKDNDSDEVRHFDRYDIYHADNDEGTPYYDGDAVDEDGDADDNCESGDDDDDQRDQYYHDDGDCAYDCNGAGCG